MIKELVVATKNKGKIKEIQQVLGDFGIEVISMEQAGFHQEIVEDGSTFEENALIKARAIMKLTGLPVLADDSGLETDFLDGAPGIYSARFAGEGASDKDRYEKLLDLFKDVPEHKRGARFVCAMAYCTPDGEEMTVRGTCEGIIAYAPKGENGFGYDPIFLLPQFRKTMAELSPEEKNRISHRGKALAKMADLIKG